jgi:holliday junction resolvase YEN1
MGVSGLWDVVRPAGVSHSLTTVAVGGFTADERMRGFRVGIDASIWFVHSKWGKEGENPELRTIFFRLTRLLKLPFLPLFVFDGPMRPAVKRGKTIDKQPHWMIEDMKRMIDAFGFEWRNVRRLPPLLCRGKLTFVGPWRG